METTQPGVGYAGVPALNRYNRCTINVKEEKVCILFPTDIPVPTYQAIQARFALIVHYHSGIPVELLAKLFGTSESLTQFDQELMELGKSIEEMVEKTPKIAGIAWWNADVIVSQLLDNGLKRKLLRLLKTIFPLECEEFLLAGLLNNCIESIGPCYDNASPSASDVMIEWKNVHLLHAIKNILELRRDLLKVDNIPDMFARLDVDFSWAGVKVVRNFLSKYPNGVVALDKLWEALQSLDSFAPNQKVKMVGFIAH
jgi:hypothetical protein